MQEPEISTIAQPIYQLGATATNRLIDLINNTQMSLLDTFIHLGSPIFELLAASSARTKHSIK
ncbi:hypothetical protein J2TS4_11860 [Paenibacillus sp. J2TS4]|nr:hypothetical protein J2TS4_11860 [Paenibacillus sp. J2TS4]